MLHSIAAHQIDNILGQARITDLIATPAGGGAQGGVLLLLPDGHCCNGSRQEVEQPTTQRLHSCACQNMQTHASALVCALVCADRARDPVDCFYFTRVQCEGITVESIRMFASNDL